MTTITIPEGVNKKQKLVAIPHEIYEKFLIWQRTKTFKTFRPTIEDKKVLLKSRLDYAKGNFMTLNELKRKLGYKNNLLG